MEPLEELRRLYEAYQNQFQTAEQARKPTEGMFGLGKGPGDHPCHAQFASDLEAFLQAKAAEGLEPGQAGQMLEFIYFAPLFHPEYPNAVYWMLIAVHSVTFPLIPMLEPETARELCSRYQKAYPRRALLPAQTKVLDALKKQSDS